MVLVVVAVAGAVLAGWLRGGRLGNLGAVGFRGTGIALAAALAQFVHALVPSPVAAGVLTTGSQVALLTFLWLNRFLAGAALVALGSTLNALVISLNGAMPVSRDALESISRHPAEVGTTGRHRLLVDGDALPALADVIGLPLLRTVVSVGDVILAAGIGLMVVHLMRRPPGARSVRARS